MAELGERFPVVLAAAAGGDEEAFAALWQAMHPALVRYLRVACGDQAEDVASETWLKALDALEGFAGTEREFQTWLIVVARNQARDQARRAARLPELLARAQAFGATGTLRDTADEVMERLGTRRALELVATLPADQAEMVALRVVVGLEPKEIATVVGRSPGAVRVAVHRGLASLARRLADERETAVTNAPRDSFMRRHA